jgi:hypothetical protein
MLRMLDSPHLVIYLQHVADEGRTGPKKQIGDPVKRREAYVSFAHSCRRAWFSTADVKATQKLYRKSKFDVYLIAD